MGYMCKKIYCQFKSHPWVSISLLLLILFTALNFVAYMQVYSMTHFCNSGPRTDNPESLSGFTKIKVLLFGVSIPKPQNSITPQNIGLTYSVHTILSYDGIDLEGWYIPHSKPNGSILLFHGYSGSKSTMLEESKALHALGYNLFLLDFRGSGGSDGNVTRSFVETVPTHTISGFCTPFVG